MQRDYEYESYMSLLAAVVERARQDASGRISGVYSDELKQALEWEAEQFCRDVLPSLADWATQDAPLRRRILA
jgi:hypothetical protein